MKHVKGPLVLLAGLILHPVAALAEPVGDGIPVGGLRLYPWLDVLFGYEDNYYRSNDDLEALGFLGPLGTWETIVIPGFRLTARSGPNAYNLTYMARIGWVQESSDDDFVDQRAAVDGNWELGIRHRLRAEYEFLHWHDRRGSDDPADSARPNFSSDPDTWESNRVQMAYSYGAPGSRGRLDLNAGMLFRRYTNNDQGSRDNDRSILGGAFYVRVRPKTSLLIETDWEGIDYTDEPPGFVTRDSDEYRVYGGVTWDATAKTSGTVKVGWLAKDFVASERQDVSDFGWEVDVLWRPRTYSTVTLVTQRRPAEASDTLKAGRFTDGVVVSSIDLDWVHYWRPFLYTKLGGMATEDEYIGTSREDNRYFVNAGVFYTIRRWLELGAEYRGETRDSNEPLAEYTNNTVTLSLRTAF